MTEPLMGKFEARVTDYTISETKAGKPIIAVTFAFEHAGAMKNLTWFGSLEGGARDITLTALIDMGLQPQNYGQISKLVYGVQSGLLDVNKVVLIDVAQEPKMDGSGTRTVVNWVNDPERAPGVKKASEAMVNQYFGSQNFGGELMALAQKIGVPVNNAPQAPQAPQVPMQNYGTQQVAAHQAPPVNTQQAAPQTQMNVQQNGAPNAGYKAPF